MTEKLKKCPISRRLTQSELEASRNTTAKIIKKIHGGLISEFAECVELHTTLRRLAVLLEFNQFTKEEETALHQCLLNVDGKEEFYLEPAADKNPPLTLDELRRMEGKPAYAMYFDGSGGSYGIVTDYGDGDIAIVTPHTTFWINDFRGSVVYKRKPREEQNYEKI